MKRSTTVLAILALVSVLLFTSADAKQIGQQFKSKGYRVAYVLKWHFPISSRWRSTEPSRKAPSMASKWMFSRRRRRRPLPGHRQPVRAAGYQGMIISHGKPQYSYDLVKNVVAKGIKVVTFDTVIADSAGKGVRASPPPSERSEMAASPSTTSSTSCSGQTRPIKVLKLWRGPGIPPSTGDRNLSEVWQRKDKDPRSPRPSNPPTPKAPSPWSCPPYCLSIPRARWT